ncbi:MAG: hypothetical protein AAB307_07695 [Deltaproteobacteria bacterium]
MARRCADNGCLLIGAAMIVTGVFILLFPEITYTSVSRDALKAERQSERTIVVPAEYSAVIVLAGGALVYNRMKIRKRETGDGVDKEAMF